MKKILLILIAVCFSAVAQAQFVFSPGLHYSTAKEDVTTPVAQANSADIDGLIADLKFGYILPMGLYLGGMYSYQTGSAATLANVVGASDDRKGNLIGPTIGYYSMMGFYLLGTYHIIGEAEASNSGASIKFTGAKGPQVDLGWVFPLASSFAIGPQLSWSSIEYSDVEVTGSATASTDYKRTHVRPYISLWFMF